jgi:hypothetical protein
MGEDGTMALAEPLCQPPVLWERPCLPDRSCAVDKALL